MIKCFVHSWNDGEGRREKWRKESD
jgi:hypothetical protein